MLLHAKIIIKDPTIVAHDDDYDVDGGDDDDDDDDDDNEGGQLGNATSCQDNHKRSNDSCQFAERGNRKFEPAS